MGAIVIISIFMLIAVFLVAFIVGLSNKGEAKEAKKETPEEPNSWYTAEMKADYSKAEAERKRAAEELNKRFKKGAFDAIHYARALEKTENILFNSYGLDKLSTEELQSRFRTVLDDLDIRYPTVREFVKAYNVQTDPNHAIALITNMQYGREIEEALFENPLYANLDREYKSLYIDILKIEKIITYKERTKMAKTLTKDSEYINITKS